jgi:hypothetical protein
MFPTVAKLKDGTFLMAYETFVRGTPSFVIESAAGGNQNEKTSPQEQPLSSQPQQPIGRCGDGVCDSIEQMTHTCPLDCLR